MTVDRTPLPAELGLLDEALEALRLVEAAMLRGVDGQVLDSGWSITGLNKARPLVRAVLNVAKLGGR